MRTLRWLPVVMVVTVLPLMLGCPGQTPGELTEADLTPDERGAIIAAVEAAGALATAIGVTQIPPSSRPLGVLPPGSVTVGTCPTVTTTVDPDAEIDATAAVAIDFGATACSTAVFPGQACSGNATGTFNPEGRSLVLSFNAIRCDSNSLSGQTQAGFEFSQVGVNLTGAFNLSWVSGDNSITTSGQGQFGYDREGRTAAIPRFDGTVSNQTATYTVAFTEVIVPFLDNPSLIPYAGLIDISGPNIRNLTILLSADSPSTGNVGVSINNSSYFTVNLFTL